ncbi:Subtilisin-like protease [Roseomonas mucosa]|uniref:S8 family serine peptidase n=1 Tax=Roseomonas TaxID=125216 RepID=UPI000C17BB21|nr:MULTISPECIES: S8 family serine peptidase [Roseomonas]ATR20512.1 hypothetical protein CTJ15_09465 [Roseomonas sp. FDAARGOS_362]UZO97255.1 Subtilisin-like protease [Roseomonas mucosa]
MIGKVLDDTGAGTSMMLFEGMNWAIQQGAEVLSMSVGFDFPSAIEHYRNQYNVSTAVAVSASLGAYRSNVRAFDAIMSLAKAMTGLGRKGTVVCAATGNESGRPSFEITLAMPAAADDVIAVAAAGKKKDGNLYIGAFSNTMPTVCAPGIGVTSAWLKEGLKTLNGTSMATPHVAGVAALHWEKQRQSNPNVLANVVATSILSSCNAGGFVKMDDAADYGAGLIQAP